MLLNSFKKKRKKVIPAKAGIRCLQDWIPVFTGNLGFRLKDCRNDNFKGIFGSMTTRVVILLIFLISAHPVFAGDTIKILMHESSNDPLPSDQAQSLQSLNGKVFFRGKTYTGSLNVIGDENGLYVVSNLPFEKYIAGVVASEVGKDWEIEALKAQAVVSRTYAIFNKNFNTEKSFHLTSSVLHQLYKGDNADHLITQAVQATKKEILTYEGKPINALYHATCEGKTELPEEVWVESYPYIKSVECNGVNAPYENWEKKFSFEQIGEAIGVDGVKDISIAAYTSTGRVKSLRIIADGSNPAFPSGSKEGEPENGSLGPADNSESSEQTIEIKATELRKKLGYKELPSTDFSLTTSGAEAFFDGRGWGHGVGLSQWGALSMARQGKSYREILAHFYPGTTIMRSEDLESQNLRYEK
jgi:stage II sporulation protein D